MLLLEAAAALLLTVLLPGLAVASWARLGRDREERWIFALVLGGPVAALVALASLLAGSSVLYWTLIGSIAAAGVRLVRRRGLLESGWSRRSRLVLGGALVLAGSAYLGTTGSTYRVNQEGQWVLDRPLQRDALFHLGLVRSLETDFPPALLSAGGRPVGYHVGYHIQLAAWSRHFGIDPADGLVRVGALLSLALLLGSAFVLARRLFAAESTALGASVLVLGSGLGFLFFSRPSLDWWSLAFLDVSLVSIFLANPLLPALPLLFAALALLSDHLETGEKGPLAAGALAAGFLLAVKMFLGAQLLGALAAAALFHPRRRAIARVLVATSIAAAPFLAPTFLAAASSNTSVSLRPFEIVRYSMEKLDFPGAVNALADVGRLAPPEAGVGIVALALALWLVGFLGLRLAGLVPCARALSRGDALRGIAAWFVVTGFPAALVFRIAPGEAEALSRLEAQNDVVWFAASSGILLWFFTAEGLERVFARAPIASALLAASVAFPATVQHFVRAARLPPDVVSADHMEAAREARSLSSPRDVWLEPPERVRPSLVAYVSGRPVVYDPYVGYDYMFVGRDEVAYLRHATAQFWSSRDPAFLAWFLDRFDVAFVWEDERALPPESRTMLESVFANDAVRLYRVRRDEVRAARASPIATPRAIPTGGAGAPFFGDGFRRARDARTRVLLPGEAVLYLPRDESPLELTFEIGPQRRDGALFVEGRRVLVAAGETVIRVELSPPVRRGLDAIGIVWRGDSPLVVRALSTS